MSKSIPQTRPGVNIGPFCFRPTLIPTLVTLLTLTLLLNLGFWQLRRADAKEAMLTHAEQQSALTSRDVLSITPEAANQNMNDTPLHATGQYLNAFNLLLDNRTHKGEPGYEVLTPLRIGNQLLLVNRGWVAQGKHRSIPPAIPAELGDVTLHGTGHSPNPDFFVLKEDDYHEVSWPFLVQKIDLEKTSQLFDDPIMPFVLRLSPEPSSYFVREWHSHTMGPEKHLGYALQWFSLAAALIAIYVGVNTHRTTITM